MEINFPLVLVVLTLVTGIIWLLDKLVLAPRRNGEPRPHWVEYTGAFFPVLFIVLVLRSFVVEPFQIPSSSMVPTLEVGDFILVNKYTYGLRLPITNTKILDVNEPRRGDVMVFFKPNENIYFIKRVVGLPGEEIRVVNNVLYVDGERVPQRIVPELSAGNPRFQMAEEQLGDAPHIIRRGVMAGRYGLNYHTVVPEGHYFMVGDNRDNSSDSRDWGHVPEDNIVGKAFAIWMHWPGMPHLPSFSRAGAIR